MQWICSSPLDNEHRIGFTSIGLERVKYVRLRYSQHEFIRLGPRLRLGDLDGAWFTFCVNRALAERVRTIHIYADAYKLAEISADGFWVDEATFDPKIPLIFTDAELADPWVTLRPRDASAFGVRFSEHTPKRIFSASEISTTSAERL